MMGSWISSLVSLEKRNRIGSGANKCRAFQRNEARLRLEAMYVYWFRNMLPSDERDVYACLVSVFVRDDCVA